MVKLKNQCFHKMLLLLQLSFFTQIIEPLQEKPRGARNFLQQTILEAEDSKKFAINYDYIPNEEIKYHLVPSSTPGPESCPLMPKLTTDITQVVKHYDFDAFRYADHFKVEKGGFWKPEQCKYIHDIAVIIPYRGRASQLNTFLHHIHPFLQKQLLSYRIFVVEQTFLKDFNRGLLMNVGYLEALKIHPYHCFIFHDVDLLPLVDMNIYACTFKPRHLSASINTWRYKLKYLTAFGGAVAILQKHFSKINGFSNKYSGWGGEDDDLIERILRNNLGYCRFSPEISRYHMLHHKAEKKNPDRLKILNEASKRFKKDGLNSLNYTKLFFDEKPLYTHIVVDI